VAVQTVRLEASFSPERLGAPTTIAFGFKISSSTPHSPVPLTSLDVLLPSEMGIAASGLGLENCVLSRLEYFGPTGCPSNARMGRGIATAQIPVGRETAVESAQIEVFSAPVQEGRLALLVYAVAVSPVDAELVFPAMILPASAPYGEGIDTSLPLVPSLPEGPDVSITSFHTTIGTLAGPDHFVYYRSVGDQRVAYSPNGLILPSSCPQGGFPFKAEFGFQDHTTATAHTTVPCPRRARPRRHGQAQR
jgi:hypothetical protein